MHAQNQFRSNPSVHVEIFKKNKDKDQDKVQENITHLKHKE